MTQDGTLRIGIIGLGGIGKVHAKALQEVDGLELVAYSGGTPDDGAELGWPEARQVGHGELPTLEGVDVVAICGPSNTHAAQALEAVRAGKHVVVEKPLALTVGEAVELTRLQRETGLLVAMVAQRRLEPEYARTKALLVSGELGEVRLASTAVHWVRDDAYYAGADWKRSMAAGGGSLMNQGVHNVDLLQWLAGPVESVTAQYATLGHDMDAEDTVVATVQFASGALGTISISTATPPGLPAVLTLHTTKGAATLGQGAVERWDFEGIEAPEAGAAASGAKAALDIGIAGHVACWTSARDAIVDGAAYHPDAVDAEATVRLLCGIYEAAETGRRVVLAEL